MRKNRILIVDDEDDVNLLFKMVLEDNGYKVDTFNDPLAALQNFTAGSYDLLLLDMVMPNMNGFELYQKIRTIDDKAKIWLGISWLSSNVCVAVWIVFTLDLC